VTVNYPCSTTIGTSCTIEEGTPAQSAVFGFAFNNGYAYASGFGTFGIGICTIGASGILDNCATSPSLSAFFYGGIAVH
jgi:UDP-3-O-[3-hydroxymyristoyl] glucosamine N-acyltransferase